MQMFLILYKVLDCFDAFYRLLHYVLFLFIDTDFPEYINQSANVVGQFDRRDQDFTQLETPGKSQYIHFQGI